MLYLSQAYSIGQVKMTSRKGYGETMVNTEVIVYTTRSGEEEVASCGNITGTTKQLRFTGYISLVLQMIIYVYIDNV